MGDATAVSTVFRVFFVFTFTYPFAPVVAQLIAEPNFNNCCQKLSFQSLSASGPCEAEYDSKFFHGGKDSSTAEQREISDKVRGGKAGVDFAIEEDNGTLILDVSKCETYLEELDIDLHDGVSWLYKWFAGILQWLVDSLPKQTLLNTASWKYVIPQLYKKYPNMDMMLNFSVSTTPDISIARNGIHATAALTISMNAIAAMNGNNITAEATLKDLILELKWSEIGSFPVKLVQAAVRTVVTDVILPLLNFNLRKGFPLPIIPSVELQAADIRYGNSFLLVCTDVHYTNDLTFVLVIEKLTNLLISS
ncbi:hypothetical protein O6H91_11G056500 [Diphasiastrum complanatum]|uniref:Uncharacterized protein n=1 Tax=Diphasiastrum complanatum TaxID=34168 RepID=A0ACC2C996_DIPCM|nr:hypothetical protein O6H91_11G056500 [Diphasiastrum complanatum]